MTVLSIIFGVLMIIGGFTCMFTPVTTLLSAGIFIGIMMLVYGIIGIVRGIRKEARTIEVVLSVLAVIVGLISLFKPGATLIFDDIMIIMFSVWVLLQGIGSIVLAFEVKGEDRLWFLGLISGILGVGLGIYSFMHPTVALVSVGILIGLYFVESGINMIVLGTALGSLHD